MFIRARKAKGTIYYQVVRGYRDEAGTVRQETISLGHSHTVSEALALERRHLRNCRSNRTQWATFGNSEVGRREFEKWDWKVRRAEEKVVQLEGALASGLS